MAKAGGNRVRPGTGNLGQGCAQADKEIPFVVQSCGLNSKCPYLLPEVCGNAGGAVEALAGQKILVISNAGSSPILVISSLGYLQPGGAVLPRA